MADAYWLIGIIPNKAYRHDNVIKIMFVIKSDETPWHIFYCHNQKQINMRIHQIFNFWLMNKDNRAVLIYEFKLIISLPSSQKCLFVNIENVLTISFVFHNYPLYLAQRKNVYLCSNSGCLNHSQRQPENAFTLYPKN